MSRQVWKGSTLLNPEPPVLVSCGAPARPNLITVGWCGTICTQPSMLSISIRPERYSYGLIKESGVFVVNLPTEPLTRAVDWCGVKSGREVDKFAALGLHAAPAAKVDTVLLEESPLNLECRVRQVIPLGSHDLFLAEVVPRPPPWHLRLQRAQKAPPRRPLNHPDNKKSGPTQRGRFCSW